MLIVANELSEVPWRLMRTFRLIAGGRERLVTDANTAIFNGPCRHAAIFQIALESTKPATTAGSLTLGNCTVHAAAA